MENLHFQSELPKCEFEKVVVAVETVLLAAGIFSASLAPRESSETLRGSAYVRRAIAEHVLKEARGCAASGHVDDEKKCAEYESKEKLREVARLYRSVGDEVKAKDAFLRAAKQYEAMGPGGRLEAAALYREAGDQEKANKLEGENES